MYKKASRLTIYDELLKIASAQKINLGFDSSRMPNKKWMVNVLYSLDEKNPIFSKIIDTEGVIGLTEMNSSNT